MVREEGQKWCDAGKTSSPIADFEDGDEAPSKECCHPAEPGKGKQTDYPLQPPKENTGLQTPSILIKWGIFWTFILKTEW